jgi:hypothetical protein
MLIAWCYLPSVFRKEYYSEIVRFATEVTVTKKYLGLGNALGTL